jgi:hypothetical protein
MGYFKNLVKDESVFTSSTDDVVVDKDKYIEGFTLAYKAVQPASSMSTINAFLDLVNPFEVKVGGKAIIQIGGKDLYALNNLWLGKRALHIGTEGANEITRICGLYAPFNLKPGTEQVSVKATRVAVGTMGTETLSISQEQCSVDTGAPNFNYTAYSHTPPSTGAYNRALDTSPTGDIIGMLVFSTTVPTTSASTISCNKLQIRAKEIQCYNANWFEMQADSAAGSYSGTAIPEGIIDNYAWLDFSNEPFKKGERFEVYVNAGDTNTVRLIPVMRME